MAFNACQQDGGGGADSSADHPARLVKERLEHYDQEAKETMKQESALPCEAQTEPNENEESAVSIGAAALAEFKPIELKRHDTPESIMRAFWSFATPDIFEEPDAHVIGGCDGEEGSTPNEMLDGISEAGYWAFADSGKRVVNFWHDGRATKTMLLMMLGHEVGHLVGNPLQDVAEEIRADSYGFAAVTAFDWINQIEGNADHLVKAAQDEALKAWDSLKIAERQLEVARKALERLPDELLKLRRALLVIERVTGDEFCEDLELTMVNEPGGKLKEASEKLGRVYMAAHAYTSDTCFHAHDAWRQDVEREAAAIDAARAEKGN